MYNRDLKRAQANNRACKHRIERLSTDTMGRDNTNKRGPKVKGNDDSFIPSPHGYSKLKSGCNVSTTDAIITLPNGVQCKENSLTHLNYLSTSV